MKQKSIRKEKIEQLSLAIRYEYQNQLGQNLGVISYKQFEQNLVVTIEGTTTMVESFLSSNNRKNVAQKMRLSIDQILKSQIKSIIEQVMDVKIVDFFIDTTIDNNMTGVVAIYEPNIQ